MGNVCLDRALGPRLWVAAIALSVVALSSCSDRKSIPESEFLEYALAEISGCLVHGRDCSRKMDHPGFDASPRNLKAECFSAVESIDVTLNGTVARLDIFCRVDDFSVHAVAQGDRQRLTKRVSFPLVASLTVPEQRLGDLPK